MGGVGTSDPVVTADGDRSFVFVRGTDAAAYFGIITGTAFSGWQSLGGVLFPTRAS
jgi:hypothetical protein